MEEAQITNHQFCDFVTGCQEIGDIFLCIITALQIYDVLCEARFRRTCLLISADLSSLNTVLHASP